MDKIEKFKEILKENGMYVEISDDDLVNAFTLYELENYSVLDKKNFNKFDILKCLHKVTMKNEKYRRINYNIYKLYEDELNKKLLEISDDGSICYSSTPEYSLVLAHMCANEIEDALCIMNFSPDTIISNHDLDLYQKIHDDFEIAQLKMPKKTEFVYERALEIEKDNFDKTINILNNQYEYYNVSSRKVALDIELRKLIKDLNESKSLNEEEKRTLNRMNEFLNDSINAPKNYTVKLSRANRSLVIYQQMYETAKEINKGKQKTLKK